MRTFPRAEEKSVRRIREAEVQEAGLLASLVSEANRDVAERFGLNFENCPKHPSFCTAEWIERDRLRGERYFLIEDEGLALGCVAYERASSDLAYLNRLAVPVGARRRGLGSALVLHVLALARADAVPLLSIGIIGEHVALRDWYLKLGFVSGEARRYPHLPFTVQMMSLRVGEA
jgi:GNAT superfamily N-acetyltransferase